MVRSIQAMLEELFDLLQLSFISTSQENRLFYSIRAAIENRQGLVSHSLY